MTTRRSFMAGILAAATPPGFVRAGVLMPVAPLIVTRQQAFDWFMEQVNNEWRAEQVRLMSPFQRWAFVDSRLIVTEIPMSEVYAAR